MDVNLVTQHFNLYAAPHKGLRAAFFELIQKLGSADPMSPAAVADCVSGWNHVHELVEAHHFHEEEYGTVALINEKVPELADEMEREHAVIAKSLENVNLVAQKSDITELFQAVNVFVGDYLKHMHFEEGVIMPKLRERATMEELLGVHDNTVKNIKPAHMVDFLRYMLPAMNVHERVGLLGGMKATAPPEVFNGIWSLAQQVLAAADVEAVKNILGL